MGTDLRLGFAHDGFIDIIICRLFSGVGTLVGPTWVLPEVGVGMLVYVNTLFLAEVGTWVMAEVGVGTLVLSKVWVGTFRV